MAASEPLNKDIDDISDAQIYLGLWTKALLLQERRLRTGDGELSADTRFAIFAASNVVRCCGMFIRHEVPTIQGLLEEFARRQPAARSIRNALEHLDEYLRGTGKSAKGTPNWFPFGGTRDEEGRVFLAIPPLDDQPAENFDVTALISDTLWLSDAIKSAVDGDGQRRFMTFLDGPKSAPE
jgi:hypothetical protein